MCGFNGSADNNLTGQKVDLLKKGLDNISHRGPDGSGEFSYKNVFLGHKRLSIIELSDMGHQPMKSENGNYYIVFNGEIYNFRELALELKINTSSDTKLLLEGFVKEGTSFFKKIRGIYSFAIYDMKNEEVLLVRDKAGVKPLYYSLVNNSLCFGSEIKSIKPLIDNKLTMNRESLYDFLNLAYCVEPSTIYNEIFALKPGYILKYNIKSNKVQINSFSSYNFDFSNNFSFKENKIKTHDLLIQASERNLTSDVPVSIALSGGIDSSLVYAYANEKQSVNGITVKMNDVAYDESHIAQSFSAYLNAPQKIINLQFDSKIELLDKLLLHFDQPYADSSLIPFYFLNKEARNTSKVLLGGDSGDEIHNGYLGHSVLPLISRTRKVSKAINFMIKFSQTFASAESYRGLNKIKNLYDQPSDEHMLYLWHSWFPSSNNLTAGNPFVSSLFSPSLNFYDKKNSPDKINSLVADNYFRVRMQSDFLRKSDMMSMINGVEFRVPMLDEDLTKHSLSIPYNQKCSFNKSKKILRALHKEKYNGLNSNLKKQGFTIPLDTWLGKDNIKYILNYIAKNDGIVNSLINKKYLKILEQSILENKHRKIISRASSYQRLLQLYSLQLWFLNN
jgi:asparagine synthase (glutamine-hydrolysing)